MTKRVLITGANSYIGTSFERYIKENYPDVKIAGMYSPPFHLMTENEDAMVIE